MNERLRDEQNIWLATIRPDGRPHLVPIWFVYVKERFWVATGAASVKVRNLAASPLVTVALESGNDPIVAEGRAEIHPRPYPPAVVEAFDQKYRWDITVDDDPDIGRVALCGVTVDRWLFGRP